MKPSAYFIGVKIRGEALVESYIRLQKLFSSDHKAIEFPNIHTSHITIFHIKGRLSPDEECRIKKTIANVDTSLFASWISGFGYFWPVSRPKLCYLKPNEQDGIVILSQLFRDSFSEKTREFPMDIDYDFSFGTNTNSHSVFIPHVTLFRIFNHSAFFKKKETVEQILIEECNKLFEKNVFERITLFWTYSGFRPQIYMEV